MAKRTLRKKIRRTLAAVMSTAMVLSTTQMVAIAGTTLATDSNATVVTEGDGTLENPQITTTTTTTTDSETGNTVVNTEAPATKPDATYTVKHAKKMIAQIT